MDNAFRARITGEIGKTIVFCVSQEHASKITQILNEIAHILFPKKYNSDFAVQVSSNIEAAQQMSINFANNNLNGHTFFLDGYKSSKTRICVTVGMMTTGYDCEDILNLCLLRSIFSPTDFIQIKGRGTRKFTFTYKQKNDFGETEESKKEKQKFKLFDFFANCEYFEAKFNYDEILKLPKIGALPKADTGFIDLKEYENYTYDPLKSMKEIDVGLIGMKIDRKLFERFETVVKSDATIAEKFQAGNIDEAEEYIKKVIFDKPDDYFNLEKLRKALKIDRHLSLREILENVFGLISKFKSKDELLDEEIDKFIVIYKPESKFVPSIRNFIKAYITDAEVRDAINKGEYSRLATNASFSMKDLRALNGWKQPAIDYITDYVSLNTFSVG